MARETVEQRFWNAYDEFMEQEGLPVHEAMAGTNDVTQYERKPWARTGGLGVFLQLQGMVEDQRGIYVAEIPGGSALNPEKHLYEESILILQGRGVTEVWHEGEAKVTFEWGEGSFFALPLNTWHRLVNGSREPALFLAVTTAPQAMESFHDNEFIFNCDYQFTKRFGGKADYFSSSDDRRPVGGGVTWYTNFIPDVRAAFLDDAERKVAGGQVTRYFMPGQFPAGHMSEWQVGMYHKAHYHGPGALLIGLRGKGYVPLWHFELGIHPYQDGHGDKVLEVQWGPRAIYCPPDGWFHQHMNTGKEPARHLAIYGQMSPRPSFKYFTGDDFIGLRSSKQGGTLIDYEDEDPEIRRRFVETLHRDGIECTMPEVTYRR